MKMFNSDHTGNRAAELSACDLELNSCVSMGDVTGKRSVHFGTNED
jgi:hypothetical protein